MSKSVTRKAKIIETLNIGEFILRTPNVQIIDERKSSCERGHLVSLRFGASESNCVYFSANEIEELANEFKEIAKYLREKNDSKNSL